MNEIKEKIEEIYDSVGPEKNIFEAAKKWRELPTYIVCMTAPVISCFLWSAECNSFPPWWIWVLIFVWIFGGTLFMTHRINAQAKKKLTLIGIHPTVGIFKFWANQEYREVKLKKFVEKLIEQKLLKDTDQDIDLVEDYWEYFDTESKNLFNDGRVVVGGVILAFCVPIWNQFLTILFKSNQAILFEITLFAMSIFLVILFLVIFIFFITHQFTDYSNRRSDKLKEIAGLLKTIRLNLKLKYPRVKD